MSRRLIMVIMIDALGHRIVRESGAFDFLEAPDGPIASVTGYSSACIPSLLTGKLPAEHGHWAMYLRDPARSIFKPMKPLIWFTASLMGRDFLTRRLVSRYLYRVGISGYFSLYEVPPLLLPQFDLCEKRDIYAPEAFPGLETPCDVARDLALPHRVWSWRTPEERNRAEMADALRAGEAQFLFFYSPHLDSVMHAHNTRSDATRACLEDFSAFTRAMLSLAEATYDEVRLLVFGDHGMADTTGTYDLLTRLAQLDLRMPEDFLHFMDSTMARFWFFKPGARERVLDLLSTVPGGRILADDECERLGILFPDRRYGEVIFLTDPGKIFVPSFMGLTPAQAMHGYHAEDVDSDTILFANYDHAPVRDIMGIGPLICAELDALA